MKVLVVGHLGNMGRRYTAILDHLGSEWIGIDQGDPWPSDGFDRVLIATPTINHISDLGLALTYGKPVLCEKPISKQILQVEGILNRYKVKGVPLQMVNQYDQYYKDGKGETIYDHYNTGKDGLFWDCINVIGLAEGKVTINNRNPLWDCEINGTHLSIGEMNLAYICMVRDWLNNPQGNEDYIISAHRKVIEYGEGCNWNPGAEYVFKA